jgi:hypothetical protein
MPTPPLDPDVADEAPDADDLTPYDMEHCHVSRAHRR